MKIRVLKIIASPDFDAVYPGAVIELPDAQAKTLCNAGAAEAFELFPADLPEEAMEQVAKEVKSDDDAPKEKAIKRSKRETR